VAAVGQFQSQSTNKTCQRTTELADVIKTLGGVGTESRSISSVFALHSFELCILCDVVVLPKLSFLVCAPYLKSYLP
jgi:hypothetical protein